MTVPLTAERARDRLDRGLPELVRAGDDPAILSYALSAIHGALEAHLRSVLASDPRVPAEIRAVALDVGAFSFLDIANAMHEYLDLPASERSSILEAHGHRQAQDHGDGFAWDRAGVESQVLVLGVADPDGAVILLSTEREAPLGSRVH